MAPPKELEVFRNYQKNPSDPAAWEAVRAAVLEKDEQKPEYGMLKISERRFVIIMRLRGSTGRTHIGAFVPPINPKDAFDLDSADMVADVERWERISNPLSFQEVRETMLHIRYYGIHAAKETYPKRFPED